MQSAIWVAAWIVVLGTVAVQLVGVSWRVAGPGSGGGRPGLLDFGRGLVCTFGDGSSPVDLPRSLPDWPQPLPGRGCAAEGRREEEAEANQVEIEGGQR